MEFYNSEGDLADSVAGFLRPAVSDGVAVIVAAAGHRKAFVQALVCSGVDASAAVRSGRLMVLDAGDTLEQFLSDSEPNAPAFARVIGGVLDRAERLGGPVRIYGEMVALLWQDNVAAALGLEELWNGLAAIRRFELLCGYPSALFAHPSAARRFEALCAQHTHVTTAPADQAWLPTLPIASTDTPQGPVRWQLPAEVTSGVRARTQLRQLLSAWGLGGLFDDAELLLSELISNAVVHAHSPVTVTISRHRDVLHVEVSDHGPGVAHRRDGHLDDTHGRGLMLVDAISSMWGVTANDDAKTVWFRLAAPAA